MSGLAHTPRLQFFPVALFTVAIGLCGFCLTLLQVEAHPDTPDFLLFNASYFIAFLALAVFVLVSVIYLIKIIRHYKQAAEEFTDNTTTGLFGVIPLSLLLLSVCFFEINLAFAKTLWMIGAILQLLTMIIFVNRWIHQENIQINQITQIWFLPVVANMVVPITGVWFAPLGFSWFFLSIGIFFWLIIFILVWFRLVFEEPLPEFLQATKFILLAPPAVGFVAITTLEPELDFMANFLYYVALFTFLLLITELPRFIKSGFSIYAWAYSFPLAAMCLANYRMYEFGGVEFIAILGWITQIILTIVILWLIFNTILSIVRGNICYPIPK